MPAKKTATKIEYESVKIRKEIVDKVREVKKETYMPISIFFELAAQEKLKLQSSK